MSPKKKATKKKATKDDEPLAGIKMISGVQAGSEWLYHIEKGRILHVGPEWAAMWKAEGIARELTDAERASGRYA